ncbi:MAG: hypothetical protein JOZ54_02515 [Acidobacteria bacterium]|nr:hypothetical protein [Acidobacteriota bacterium]
MPLRPTHRFLRVEFDWLAQDRDGMLGFFSTAGGGPIPKVLDSDGVELELRKSWRFRGEAQPRGWEARGT